MWNLSPICDLLVASRIYSKWTRRNEMEKITKKERKKICFVLQNRCIRLTWRHSKDSQTGLHQQKFFFFQHVQLLPLFRWESFFNVLRQVPGEGNTFIKRYFAFGIYCITIVVQRTPAGVRSAKKTVSIDDRHSEFLHSKNSTKPHPDMRPPMIAIR